MSNSLAQNLTHARTHYKRPDGLCGLTQEALAEKAGVKPNAVSGIETGLVTYPRALTLARLATALDTTVEALTGEAEAVPETD